MDEELAQLARQCPACNLTQKKPPVAPLHSRVYPTGPWERVHVDLAQFKNDYYLVVTDAFSKWLKVMHLGQNTTTTHCGRASKVFSTLGLPRVLVSDNGPQFTSSEFSQFLEENGIRQKRVPPYHPASGLAERMIQELKKSLKQNEPKAIPTEKRHHLNNFLLKYRTAPHCNTGHARRITF